MLMTCLYQDLGSASDWSCCMGNLLQPIRSPTQILVVTHHMYGISALISQTSFHEEASGGVEKYRLFSLATHFLTGTFFRFHGKTKICFFFPLKPGGSQKAFN